MKTIGSGRPWIISCSDVFWVCPRSLRFHQGGERRRRNVCVWASHGGVIVISRNGHRDVQSSRVRRLTVVLSARQDDVNVFVFDCWPYESYTNGTQHRTERAFEETHKASVRGVKKDSLFDFYCNDSDLHTGTKRPQHHESCCVFFKEFLIPNPRPGDAACVVCQACQGPAAVTDTEFSEDLSELGPSSENNKEEGLGKNQG